MLELYFSFTGELYMLKRAPKEEQKQRRKKQSFIQSVESVSQFAYKSWGADNTSTKPNKLPIYLYELLSNDDLPTI